MTKKHTTSIVELADKASKRSNTMYFKVTYQYVTNDTLRSATAIVTAKDSADARKQVVDGLNKKAICGIIKTIKTFVPDTK